MMQPIAAIVIPTVAAKRTKHPASREDEIRQWGAMIRQVITASAASVQKNGFEPRIVLVDNSPNGIPDTAKRQLERLQPLLRAKIVLLHRPRKGWAGSFWEGARFAIRELNAQAVVSIADDFPTEAKKLGNLLQPLRTPKEKKGSQADFVFAKWQPKNIPSFPPAQVLNERMVSLLTTFALPAFQIKANETLPVALQRAIREREELQAYTGLFAFNSQAFQEIDSFLQRHFQNPQWGHAGLDPILLLAAGSIPGIQIKGLSFPRRFEHFYPKNRAQQEAFAGSRKSQFDDAINAIQAFLRASGQRQKEKLLEEAKKTGRELIQTAPRRWPHGFKRLACTTAKHYHQQKH